jgi:DNA polymerase III delta prime subunit
MTVPAANALLKTLEEPGGEFIVVLLAPSAGGLLPTIVSRCHRLYFPGCFDPSHAAGGAGASSFEVDLSLIAEVHSREFHRRFDMKEWLERVAPNLKTARQRVKTVLAALFRHLRRRLETIEGGDVDRHLEVLEDFLDLDESLDSNVNPELVIEKVISDLVEKKIPVLFESPPNQP